MGQPVGEDEHMSREGRERMNRFQSEPVSKGAGPQVGGAGSREPVLITIVISNFNYESYLAEAIDSALRQDYPHVEVLVVDDGSTDHSRHIIESYRPRITAIYQDNAGQGSTFNSAFAVSKGQVLCFLDADDMFLPNKASTIAGAYARDPKAGLIYHQLQLVDAAKKPLGSPWPRSVWCADIRSRVEESGGWWPWPTTGGLCASRAFLSKVLPMPCAPYRLCADAYIGGLAHFFGPVSGIKAPLSLCRIHGANYYNFRDLTRRAESERRFERLNIEFNELRAALHDRFGIDSAMRLEDNPQYHRLRRAIDASYPMLKVFLSTCRTSTLPASMKVREMAKIILNHG
jgi:glycosyltransferase involved in cell wall biosynthesis